MMRCFLPCFSTSKRQNHFSHQPSSNANTKGGAISIVSTSQPTLHNNNNTNLQESIHWISQSKIQHDHLETTKENKTTPQDNHDEQQKQECSDESLFSVSINGCGKPISPQEENDEIEVNSTPIKLHCAKDASESSQIVPLQEPKPEFNEAKPMNKPLLKYRYQDCSDDGYSDDINLNEGSSEESSLFSLSTDHYYDNNKRKQIPFSSSEKETFDNEVSSIMLEEPQQEEESEANNIVEKDDVCSSVLNPIENVSQSKVKPTTLLNPIKKDKENINWNNQPEPSLKLSLSSSNRKMNETEKEKEEIGVNTSLSSWLVESENKYNTPKRSDVDDRPILGALTIEEIRKYSCSKSRSITSSRTHSPEDTPIIGTVGSYWNHSQHRKSSKSNKYEKDRKRDCSSTTIKTRLEPAFEAATVTQNLN